MAGRVMIAGTHSGCGKTTVSCAVMAALAASGRQVAAFKCGPDYIDPMFHRKASGLDSRNLDIFLMGEAGVQASLARHSAGSDIAILEAVMGFYDGQGSGGQASSWHISQATRTPVVLVVDVRGAALSVCATIQGFLDFDDNRICAVILNGTTESGFPYYRQMIEERLSMPVIGYLPFIAEAAIESRQLGLVTAQEIADIQEKLALLGQAASRSIDLEALCAIAEAAPPLEDPVPMPPLEPGDRTVRLAVSRDEAFCFYYEDNHELFEMLGAELCFFSPLTDQGLPPDVDGLVLWGGYPELWARQLEANAGMRASVLAAVAAGLPTYAECGGYIYLQQALTDLEGQEFSMVGALPGSARVTDRLQGFGYTELTARRDNLLSPAGWQINSHFFHYTKSDLTGDGFLGRRSSGATSDCVVVTDSIVAGHQHLHFGSYPAFARNFLDACYDYKRRHTWIT